MEQFLSKTNPSYSLIDLPIFHFKYDVVRFESLSSWNYYLFKKDYRFSHLLKTSMNNFIFVSSLNELTSRNWRFSQFAKSYGEIPIVIQGAGAGSEVTARGVLQDILKIAEKIKIKDTIFL